MQPAASGGPSPPTRAASQPVGREARELLDAHPRVGRLLLAPPGPVEERVRRRRGGRVEDRLATQRVVGDGLRGPEAGGAGRFRHRPAQETQPFAELRGSRRGVVGARGTAALVAVEQPWSDGHPARVDGGERRNHRRDAHALDVEVAQRGQRVDGAAPPRDVGVVLEALGARDPEAVRHTRAGDDVAVAVGRDRLDRRRPDVDAYCHFAGS